MTHIGLNAHLLSPATGYRAAGIHNYIDQLLAHLPPAAPDDWRFTAMVGRDVTAHYDRIDLRRSRWDTQNPLKRIVWEQVLQPPQLREFDLYHALAFAAPLIVKRPFVVTVYDLTFIRYPHRLTTARRLYLKAFTRITCERAGRVIAISESTGRDLTDLLGIPPEKIDVTPLGYDRLTYRVLTPPAVAEFRQRKNLPERFWLFLGTLEPRKNLPVLLNAYARLSPSDRLPLMLAGGKGWQTDEIYATIARHQLENDVHMVGFVPDDEIALWYNAAEAFLYPSVFEGFGLPVLEAMACGTPVITSNASSLPEVAEGAGLTLPPDDVNQWHSALVMAANDANWRQVARLRGLDKAQHFTWDTTARLTLDSYQRALGRSD